MITVSSVLKLVYSSKMFFPLLIVVAFDSCKCFAILGGAIMRTQALLSTHGNNKDTSHLIDQYLSDDRSERNALVDTKNDVFIPPPATYISPKHIQMINKALVAGVFIAGIGAGEQSLPNLFIVLTAQ